MGTEEHNGEEGRAGQERWQGRLSQQSLAGQQITLSFTFGIPSHLHGSPHCCKGEEPKAQRGGLSHQVTQQSQDAIARQPDSKTWVLTTGLDGHGARCLSNPTGTPASLSLGPSLGRKCWELVLATELDSEGVPTASVVLEASPEAFVLRSPEWVELPSHPDSSPSPQTQWKVPLSQGVALKGKGGTPHSLLGTCQPWRSLMNWLCVAPPPRSSLSSPRLVGEVRRKRFHSLSAEA